MTIILQPLALRKINELLPLIEVLDQVPGFWCLYGEPKVGKTALLHKLMLDLQLKEPSSSPMYISISDRKTKQYWEGELKSLKVNQYFETILSMAMHIDIENSKDDVAEILYTFFENTHNNNQNIKTYIVDGIEELFNNYPKQYVRLLLMTLVEIGKEKGTVILFTSRSKSTFENMIEASPLATQPTIIRYMHLERPLYMGGKITEFGQALLNLEI